MSDARLMTEEEYLKSEPYFDVRREYYEGQAYAMADSKRNHNILSGNLVGEFRNHLKGFALCNFQCRHKSGIGGKLFLP